MFPSHDHEGLKGDAFFITLIHEIGHAVWDATGLNETSIPHDIQEIIVDNFAKGLVQNLDIKLKK